MTEPSEGAELPKVDGPATVEYVPLELLGMNPDEPVGTELMTLCAAIVRAFAPNPDGVRLVITGDFVSSVRARSVTEHQQQNYDVARNAGEVGGKTMRLPDGTIDVLLPAYLFAPDPDEEILAGRRIIATRTVTHEAFHVAMNQAGETVTDYTSEPFVRGNLLYIADAVMEEYRAEVSLAENLRTAPEGAWEPLKIVTHLRDALRRIACVEYQAHLDVGHLCTDIGVECLHAWQLLAYIAAAQTQDDGTVAALPDKVTGNPLWVWMVEPHWSAFTSILSKIPPALVRTSRADLEPLVGQLADELHEWLETLGFRWRQVGVDTEFLVVHWAFDDRERA